MARKSLQRQGISSHRRCRLRRHLPPLLTRLVPPRNVWGTGAVRRINQMRRSRRKSFSVNMTNWKMGGVHGLGETGGDATASHAAKFCHGDRVKAALESPRQARHSIPK